MGAARIDDQIGLERPGLPVIAAADLHARALLPASAGGAQRVHLGTLEEGHVRQALTELTDGPFDERSAGIELPQPAVGTSRPPVRPQCRGVPSAFNRHRAALTHPGFEAGEKALELAQSASEQVVNMAS